MNRSVDIEIKGNNSASPAFAEVAAGLRKIANETRALRAEEKLEIEQQRKLTELIKADRQEKEEAARQQQKLTDLIKQDRAARAEAIRKEGQAVEAATLGPYEKYISAQFKLADLRKKGAISEAAHAAALEQEKQKYLQLAASAGKVNPVMEAKRQADAAATKAAKEAKVAEDQRRIALQATGDAIRNSVLTPLGSYRQRVLELNKALRDGAIDEKTRGAAMRKAADDYRAASRGTGVGGRLMAGAARFAAPLAAAVGTAAIGREIQQSYTELDELAKRSDKLGMIPGELQKLQYAAGQTGVEVDTLEKAMQRYVKVSGKAATDPKSNAAATFTKLGISASQLKNLDLPGELSLISDALLRVNDDEERLRITMELFGDRAADVVNLFGKGSGELEALFKRFEDLRGPGTSREDLATIEQANDAWDDMKVALRGVADEAAITAAPAFKALSDQITNSLISYRKWKEATAPDANSTFTDRQTQLRQDAEGLSIWNGGLGFRGATLGGRAFGLNVERQSIEETQRRGRAPLDIAAENQRRGLTPEKLAELGREAEADEALRQQRLANLPANRDGRIAFSPFAAARGLTGAINRAAGDGASLLDRGSDAAGLLGPAANNWLRNARGDMEGMAERAEERVKEAQRAEKDLKSAAERILRENRTPEEIFLEEKKKAEDLFKAGLLPREMVDREIKRAGDDRDRALESLKDKEGKGKGKREGIPEPLQAVVSRSLTRGAGNLDPALAAQQSTAKSAGQLVSETKNLIKQLTQMQRELHTMLPGLFPEPAGAT